MVEKSVLEEKARYEWHKNRFYDMKGASLLATRRLGLPCDPPCAEVLQRNRCSHGILLPVEERLKATIGPVAGTAERASLIENALREANEMVIKVREALAYIYASRFFCGFRSDTVEVKNLIRELNRLIDSGLEKDDPKVKDKRKDLESKLQPGEELFLRNQTALESEITVLDALIEQDWTTKCMESTPAEIYGELVELRNKTKGVGKTLDLLCYDTPELSHFFDAV